MIKRQIASLLLVYSRRKSLSTGLRKRRLRRQNGGYPGFLLIEMMVALVAIGIVSAGIAGLQGYVMQRYHDACHYLAATTIAMTVLEQPDLDNQPKNSCYTVTKKITDLDDATVAYQLLTVTVSWNDAHGTKKEISMTGGMVPHAQ